MPQSKSVANDQIAMLIGQLLATSEAASAGIKALSEESRQNSKAIVAAVTTLSMVEKTATELVRLVKDGNGQESLVAQLRGLRTWVDDTDVELNKMDTSLSELRAQVDDLVRDKHERVGGANVILYALAGFAWLITTVIAVIGVLK